MHPGDPRAQARLTVQREPSSPLAWILLAEAELDAGDAVAGETASRHALALLPGHPEALARLGRAQWMQGRHADAADTLGAAAARAPDHPGIAVWLAHALEDVGQPEAAADAYARAHALAPAEPQLAAYLLAWRRKLCDWRDLDALSAQVRDAVRRGQAAVEPFAFLSEDSTPAEQLACARLRANGIARATRPLPAPGAAASPAPATVEAGCDPTLRVGFLSNGFGAHPTGLLTVALLEALATQPHIELHLFALNVDDHSAIRQRLQAATTLQDLAGRSHLEVAQRIRATGIEVLFDLRGWGGGGRPEVLAMRPAPVQVNWLAYPGTSGAPWIDAVLADRFVLPASLVPAFSEQVHYLPRCFQPSDTTRALTGPPERSECGLPEAGTGVVFCCFNNSYKLNPASMQRAWAVLRGVPGSVLWLLSGPGDADRRLRDAAGASGVEPARLVFMRKQPHDRYMARLQHADLFLDTGPYNAHTTASDALWAGCPVLTRPGETFAARVAGSLNHHLGMPSMNVASDEAFIARAIELGNDPLKLQAVRAELAALRLSSGLFDMGAFAVDFAAAVVAIAACHGSRR